jgi:LuxR family maltose regulon positive regulatory protein
MAIYLAERPTTRARRPAASVGDPVLTSKITAPSVPGWAIPRPRISELMASGAGERRLTVVTGPPGAGKTMAMALWAAADPGAVAWLALDDYDNRPGVFWSYVVAALRRAGLAVPRAWSATSRGPGADHPFLLRLASTLAAQDPPVTLVIDDLHLLTKPELLDGLDYVLRNAVSGLRLVVSSRTDPLLPLHRHRLAGQLIEIRAADLAFNLTETGLLLAQHGITLTADSLECLTRQTEGWAAGIRLAAISMDTHPDPDQFVKELIGEDTAVAGYLVEEVLNSQSPEVREVLVSTSILDRFNAALASELVTSEHAARILPAMARANAFVQPLGRGWYRYHTLFAQVLRLKLRREHPGRIALLHRRAARWYERNGTLTDAVRHAGEAGDWQLAASMVIDGLAIGELIEPRGSRSLAGGFRNMPTSKDWSETKPLLVSAALSLAAGRFDTSAAAVGAAEGLLECLPADQEVESRLAAAMIRLAACRRSGDLAVAAAAAARAEMLVEKVSRASLARHPEISTRVLAGRGVVELWSGHLDEAACVLNSGVAAAADSGSEYERADCLGQLALTEALRGRLRHAANLAAQVTALTTDGPASPVQHPNPASLVALALVHLERNELREARNRLKQADAVLSVRPDQLAGAVASLVAACCGLADGRPGPAAEKVAGARRGRSIPRWLERRLSVPRQATVGVVERLTERELEVLRHVSGMLNSAEIAREMYISVNTVKTHLRSIYRKLAATHRGDAVRRARQLELI